MDGYLVIDELDGVVIMTTSGAKAGGNQTAWGRALEADSG